MQSYCLIIIDMQNDFLDSLECGRLENLITQTNELIAAFRNRLLPIIWVRQEFRADLSDTFLEMQDKQVSVTIEGTKGVEIHAGLDRYPGDIVILKKRYSAFFETPLQRVLEDLGSKKLVISGINTHACIRMTAIDAYQRDYRVVLATDCTDSYDAEHAAMSIRYMRNKIACTLSNSDIMAELFGECAGSP
jgi:nicotinamidase-related amidase